MIRTYRKQDLDEVLDIWYRASRLAHPFLDRAFLDRERENIATVHLAKAETWVYVRDRRLVGFIALLDNEVGALFVAPKVQGTGIGRALMDHARTLHDMLEVDVFEANHIGRRFYDRYGFIPVCESVHEATGQALLRMRFTAAG